MPPSLVQSFIRQLRVTGPGDNESADADLLESYVAHRDDVAFETLVHRHGPMVFGVCCRVLGNRHDAADAFQATFLVLVRKAASLHKPHLLGNWLFGVANRTALRARNNLRRRKARQAQVEPMPEPTIMPAEPGSDLLAILDREISRLPDKYRVPFVLFELQGHSRKEVAGHLQVPLGTVASRLAMARRILARKLARHAPDGAAKLAVLSLGATTYLVPGDLLAATMRSVRTITAGGTTVGIVAAEITSLADGVVRNMLLSKLKISFALLLFAAMVVGAGQVYSGVSNPAAPPQTALKMPPPFSKSKRMPTASDLYDEPLPADALARLGTTRFRLGNMIYAMALSPDGRTAVTVGGNSQTQFWDVESGKIIRQIEWKQGGGGRVVACSPDGKLVAYVHDRGVLRLLNAADGKQLVEQWLGMTFTTSLAFSPDSTVLATGGFQATYGRSEDTKSNSLIALWKWDGAALKPLWEARPDHEAPLEGPRTHGISSLAFSPNGKRLATGSHKHDLIRIWDVSNGKELRHFHASGDQVGALAFAPAAGGLASGTNDGGLTLWDPDSGTKKWQTKQPGEVRSLAFTPDGKTLAAGGGAEYGSKQGNNPFLVLLDAESGKNERGLAISHNSVASVAFSKDGLVMAAGLGGNLQFWQGSTGKERAAPHGHATWISDVAITSNGRTAVTAGGDGKLIVWDLASGREERRLEAHLGEVRAIGLVPGDKLLASAGTDQMVRIWDLATGKEVRHLAANPDGLLYAFAVSPDGKLVAAGDYHNGDVFIWDLATGKVLHQIRISDELGRGIMRLAFSPDSKTLAGGESVLNARRMGRGNGEAKSLIYLWDALTGEKRLQILAHSGAIESLAFSPDGATIASSGWSDKSVRIWDSIKGDQLFELPVGQAHGVARFSPDGKTLACALENIAVWEVASKKLRRTLTGSAPYVQTLAYSPDGRMLVSGSMDSTGMVWDMTCRPQAVPTADRLPALWKDLASPDADVAGKSIWALVASAKLSVPFITDRLGEVPSADPKQIQRLIADLDSNNLGARQTAEKKLESLGKRAEPALRAAIKQGAALEQRLRIEQLLKKRETLQAAPEVLQVLRGIEVLEHADTPEAASALAQFAKATSDDYFRQEALAAGARLRSRPAH